MIVNSPQELLRLIKGFSGARVLVLGDVMLDVYQNCRPLGVANEAPVPLLEICSETSSPGGASNVARNLAQLGVQTRLFGRVGDDAAGRQLAGDLLSVKVDFQPSITNAPTIRKTRVLAESHYYLRLDEESVEPIEGAELAELLASIEAGLTAVDAVVISDYDKGLFTADSLAALGPVLDGFKGIVLADLKPQNLPGGKWLDVLTPNLGEARAMLAQFEAGPVEEFEDTQVAEKLSRALGCEVVLTLGAQGMVLAQGGRLLGRLDAFCKSPHNSSGAGDTVLAVLAAALACGGGLSEAALLASLAASISVSHRETHAVSSEELVQFIEASQEVSGL